MCTANSQVTHFFLSHVLHSHESEPCFSSLFAVSKSLFVNMGYNGWQTMKTYTSTRYVFVRAYTTGDDHLYHEPDESSSRTKVLVFFRMATCKNKQETSMNLPAGPLVLSDDNNKQARFDLKPTHCIWKNSLFYKLQPVFVIPRIIH